MRKLNSTLREITKEKGEMVLIGNGYRQIYKRINGDLWSSIKNSQGTG